MGPLLTVLITVGIFLRKLPSNVDEYERVAMLGTGLRWEIGSVEYRKSNHIRFKNVRILRSSGKPLFAASNIDLVYMSGGKSKEDRNRLFPGAINAQADGKTSSKTLKNNNNDSSNLLGSIKRFLGVSDRGEGFWYLYSARSLFDLGDDDNVDGGVELRECFLKLISQMEELSGKPIFIKLDEIDVIATSLKQVKLRFVAGNLYQTESAIRSEWSFFIPKVSETEREEVSIVRQRNSQNLSVTLKTGKMPLPCEFIAIFCPSFRFLGQHPSRVSGEIMASVDRLGGSGDGSVWSYSLRNVFFNEIDISQIIDENIPYILRGKIMGIQVNEAFFGGGKLQADGWVEVIDGVVDSELFRRLAKRFSLTVLPENFLESPRTEYPFTQCIFYYELQHDGVKLWAKYSSDARGYAVMSNNGNGVQTLPMSVFFPNDSKKMISYHDLLSIFASDSTPIIPLIPLSKFFVPIIPNDEIKKSHPNTKLSESQFQIPILP
ncbi:MAG: hypothetical protein LBL39_00560 [Planctomycetaceae bacterium]|jgi:hypothetical protein|nr:hypothetical protein [Planctomycetaceae bacterium]